MGHPDRVDRVAFLLDGPGILSGGIHHEFTKEPVEQTGSLCPPLRGMVVGGGKPDETYSPCGEKERLSQPSPFPPTVGMQLRPRV